MELTISQMPIWLSVIFVVVFSLVPVFLISGLVKQGNFSEGDQRKLRWKIKSFYWVYFAIVALVSFTGFFTKNVMPPRIIVTSVLPLFIFYWFYVQKRDWFVSVFKSIKVEHLIYVHLFRFVGVFFFLAYVYDVLPKSFAFIGGGGDILTALFALPVLLAFKKGWKMAKTLAWIWNIFGLIDIISVLISAVLTTKQAIETNVMGVEEFGAFPLSWIPAFAPATIIFLHLLIFRKLKEECSF